MSKALRLCLPLVLVIAAIVMPARKADAGIRCSSYRWLYCDRYICCSGTCVYCEDQATGEILSEVCDDGSCWEREF
jgi:hypothetical protein